jgi:hypothetical protein
MLCAMFEILSAVLTIQPSPYHYSWAILQMETESSPDMLTVIYQSVQHFNNYAVKNVLNIYSPDGS